MFVRIGKYKNEVVVYNYISFLEKIIGNEKTLKINDYLQIKLNKIFPRRRKIIVRIDNYDVWNMDHTLAIIIHPMLIKLKKQKQGVPKVDSEDIPNEMFVEFKKDYKEWGDGFSEKSWNYVLDEMIWSFSTIIDDEIDYLHDKEKYDRVKNGLRLFSKYYLSLWD